MPARFPTAQADPLRAALREEVERAAAEALPALVEAAVRAAVASVNGDDDLLRVAEAATFVGLKPSSLNGMRCRGDGPRFVRITNRPGGAIGYLKRDLRAWLEGRRRTSTSEDAVVRRGRRTRSPAADPPDPSPLAARGDGEGGDAG